MPGRSFKNKLSLGSFNRIHQRTASVKSFGIPLIPYKNSLPSDLDIFSVSGNEPEFDDDSDCGPFDDSNIFEIIDMHGSQDSTSSTLPAPVVQNRLSQCSIAKNRRDDENDASAMVRLKKHLLTEVDGDQSTAPLSMYCFMTGFIDSVTFSAIFVWCAFQTGNSLQLALALARLFSGQHDHSFHIADRQALCSVLTFIFGAFIGRIGDKLGCKTRLWLALGTFIQTLFTMAAAIAIWQSHQGSVADARANPAWTNVSSFVCVGFLSASMGLQGIMGKRVNTQFTTTVVLTTTWCELMADPKLFDIRRMVISRDHKIIAIGSLFFGGFIGRLLIDSIGSAATLGIGTGIRLIVSVWWLFVPERQAGK
ncbi:uncharacterized protein F5891DRAFT_1073292 [Suillus fuscotomentosus]|uniref:DUF1275 domain protein n=1 Tax=Suillus fuscotomentosus TaxID=1912939 RepID=A0AAD4DQI1_9AGAM|nr:uncharacterized protein F5891DRAFT_1073292 [Suillus fuscotomentosus]KAG1889661.1 hypothetical protein F5891DRAFT_1073292 [Suillus fuscotomentosus]